MVTSIFQKKVSCVSSPCSYTVVKFEDGLESKAFGKLEEIVSITVPCNNYSNQLFIHRHRHTVKELGNVKRIQNFTVPCNN